MNGWPARTAEVVNELAAVLGTRLSWGEEPCLYAIRVHSGRCQVDPAPVPPSWWADGPLGEVLARIARTARTAADLTWIPGIQLRPDTYGTAVRFEGHSAPRHPTERAQFREAEAAAAGRGAGPAPDLAAVRFVIGADRAGVTYLSRQQQGWPTIRSTVTGPSRETGQAGPVTTAVRQLTAAVTGMPVPGQEPWAEPGR